MNYKQQQQQQDDSSIATSTAAIIAKVVFCSSSCIEMRRFSIQDMDFIQFCALVADSLQCSSHIEDSLELRYMDVQDDDWVIFSSESEWNEAKRLYSSESKNVMKIKVILKDDTEIKQHCSLNSRAKKRSSSRQSLSAPGCMYTKPERHQLTVCFSDFEEFSRKMREMAAESSSLSSEHNSSDKKTKKQSKKRSSDSSPRRKKKSSEKRKSRKTESCAQSANSSSWGGFPNCESDWVGCSVGQPSSTIAGI